MLASSKNWRKKDELVAELRVEVEIENCPDGAGEGR